jgi:hypothetical protein
MALHDLTDTIAIPREETATVDANQDTDSNQIEGRVKFQLPSLMRDSFTQMVADGVYLIGTSKEYIFLSIV